jgi:hypothetical protein
VLRSLLDVISVHTNKKPRLGQVFQPIPFALKGE